VYRLIEVEREEGLGNGLGKGGNTIDVWRRVEDVCEGKEGLVNERHTMKMPLDRGLRQVVRNLRPSGSGQNREKKSRRSKMNGKRNTGSGWIARGSMQRNTAMTDRESERQQREGLNTQCSDLSTDSMRTTTTHVSAHQHRCASVKELLKSPETSKTLVPSTTQLPYTTQSQRRRSRPPISGSPFGQPTMSPEQSKNFVFGNRNSSSVESLLKTNNSGSTIRIVPEDGDHAITHRGSKKMSPAVQFVSVPSSAFAIKDKPQTMAQISGSLGSKSNQYKGNVPRLKASGRRLTLKEEEKETPLDMDEAEEEWDEEGMH